MQIELGKMYVTRKGDLRLISSFDAWESDNDWRYSDSQGLDTYREDGTAGYRVGVPDDEDLVAEVRGTLDDIEPYQGPLSDGNATDDVLTEVFEERERQETKWGVQNHVPVKWLPILMEEVGEVARAICEAGAVKYPSDDPNWANYREELVQVAAVAVAMIEAFDRAALSSKQSP